MNSKVVVLVGLMMVMFSFMFKIPSSFQNYFSRKESVNVSQPTSSENVVFEVTTAEETAVEAQIEMRHELNLASKLENVEPISASLNPPEGVALDLSTIQKRQEMASLEQQYKGSVTPSKLKEVNERAEALLNSKTHLEGLNTENIYLEIARQNSDQIARLNAKQDPTESSFRPVDPDVERIVERAIQTSDLERAVAEITKLNTSNK